jgi:hypothetical protein
MKTIPSFPNLQLHFSYFLKEFLESHALPLLSESNREGSLIKAIPEENYISMNRKT